MAFTPLTPALAAKVVTWLHSAAETAMFAGPSLPWPLTADELVSVAASEQRRAWVLVDEEEPVAFGTYRLLGDAARIGWVVVNPVRRGEGWGRALMVTLVESASAEPGVRRITLGVYEQNSTARALYADLGFLDSGERRTTLVDGSEWISLDLELPVPTTAPISPLLEFDPAPRAFIEPGEEISRQDVPAACVITFFGDSVERLRGAGARVLAENRWEDGSHPLLEIEHDGGRLAVLHSGVGAPLAAGLLEEAIAMGCRVFVVCGGAGVLRPDIAVGHLMVVTSALRDEGTSHHYRPAGRWIDLQPEARQILTDLLSERGVPFVAGPTWTTDAPYRETSARIASRREEGCITVEMEAAALAAVAEFRNVRLAQVLYAGDDLSGPDWDNRDWQSHADVRDGLIRLAGSAALRIAARLPA